MVVHIESKTALKDAKGKVLIPTCDGNEDDFKIASKCIADTQVDYANYSGTDKGFCRLSD